MAKSKEVVKEDGTSIAVSTNFASDAGMGMENSDSESFAIPYLSLLQALSPQLDENDGAYIEGAKQGMLFNNVTSETFKEVVVIPAAYKREIIEWIPRADGGGLVGRFEVGQEPKYQIIDGKWKTEDGHDLADTRQHYVLILKEDGTFEPAVVSMASSQLKKSKRWMTMMQNFKVTKDGKTFTPPTFAVKYKLSAVPESNDKGKWQGWKISSEGVMSESELELFYNAGKKFNASVNSGEVKTADPVPETESQGDNW